MSRFLFFLFFSFSGAVDVVADIVMIEWSVFGFEWSLAFSAFGLGVA